MIFVRRLLLRSGDHSILRTPAPSCTLLPATKQVEDRAFACASRADSTPRPICAMSALPPKADMCGALAHVYFGPKVTSSTRAHVTVLQTANTSNCFKPYSAVK